LYEAVVELRERRLDEEEVAAEVSRALEGLAKDKTMLGKKARLLDTSLAAINQVGVGFGVTLWRQDVCTGAYLWM
jgi:hypothetical protein